MSADDEYSADVIDTAAGMPMTPVTAGVVALGMMARPEGEPPPYACCPHDDEPLISTFERRGAEFCCLVCGRWYGFMSPKPLPPTPALDARHAELYARWRAGERPA